MAGRVDRRKRRSELLSDTLRQADQNLSRHIGSVFRVTNKILVLAAIDDELDKARAPEGVEVTYSGVGKVNAASAATRRFWCCGRRW